MHPLIGLLPPLLVAYAVPLWWCWEMWWRKDGYYSHGPLVPLVMAVSLWRSSARRGASSEPAARRGRLDRRGFALLVPALLLHLAGALLTIDSLSAASLVLAVPGCAMLALGEDRLRGRWPFLWMAAFAVPLPMFAGGRLAFALKELVVGWGVAIASWTGLDLVRDGALLRVPGVAEPLLVADPCGGLRSLLAMLFLAYVVAFCTGPRSPRRRAALLAFSVPIALSVNAIRIASVSWFARFWGVRFASGTGHDALNGAAWVLDLAALFGLDWLLCRRLARRGGASLSAAGGAAELSDAARAASISARPVVLALYGAAIVLLALGLYRPQGESLGRAEKLPERIAGFQLEQRFEMRPRYLELLGTSDAVWRSYLARDGTRLFVVAVFHEENWKSVHPPRLCIEGSGMVITSDEVVPAGADSDWTFGRIVADKATGGPPYVGLYAYGSKDFVTGSYSSFFWHHAPRALLRAGTAGFLLRVETNADGGMDAAEAHCRELLLALLAPAMESVR
ncbi:MAG: hypothetical protein Fur0037_25950 [Planctomycetota bacterium]